MSSTRPWRALELPYPVSVGRVEAGEWSSSVPDRLVFEGRLGVRVGEDPAAARAALEAAVRAADGEEPPVEIAWTGGAFASGETDPGDPWVARVRAAVAAERGAAPVVGVPYGADMRLFTARGIPAVMVGTPRDRARPRGGRAGADRRPRRAGADHRRGGGSARRRGVTPAKVARTGAAGRPAAPADTGNHAAGGRGPPGRALSSVPMPVDHAAVLPERATELLHRLAGPQAEFREHQLEAVRDLVEDRARVLCVQRTGWGKSAVYFLATALLRERGAGPALIVSPLLALMRNQIAAAGALGIRAHTINSTNRDAWAEVRALLAEDAVDLLLISPERLNNPSFRDEMLPLFAARVGLVVVDEAHCISDWGHDFRPDYRRMEELLARLPDGVAVLGTTATANERVVADVERELGGGAPVRTYRGPLGRRSLRFEVVDLPGQPDRLAWLATWLPRLPGSGIVYTLTKRDSELVAEWLTRRGISAEAYSGEVETERRVAVEERLLRNEVKAVVATSALGMGYDKPDLGFVVHYQAPGSVVAYYQQVGRAGRGVDNAEVVLLRGAEDRRIQDFFIEQAFPRRDVVDAGARAPEPRGRGRRDRPGAHGPGQPRPRPHRGDAQGARRRGRGRPRGDPLGRPLRRRRGTTTPTATPASPRCAGASRRPWPPSGPTGGASCGRCRRSWTIRSPPTAAAARSAPARATTVRSTPRSCARPPGCCARGRSCSR